MVLHGPRAEHEPLRDLVVVAARGHEAQDLDLPLAEVCLLGRGAVIGPRTAAQTPEHVMGHPRRDERLACRGGPHAGGYLLDGRVLEQVPTRSGEQGVEDAPLVGCHGQHEDLRVRVRRQEVARGVHPGETGKVQIHHHDVRAGPRCKADGVLGVRRLSDHADPLLLEQFTQATPEQVVVIDHKRTDHCLDDEPKVAAAPDTR